MHTTTNGRRTRFFITTEPQADHNEPGQPFVAFEEYEADECTGCRRLAYGATEDAAHYYGERNASAFPIGTDIPLWAMVQRAHGSVLFSTLSFSGRVRAAILLALGGRPVAKEHGSAWTLRWEWRDRAATHHGERAME